MFDTVFEHANYERGLVLQSNIKSFTAWRSLLNPDEVEIKRFYRLTLSDIGGNEGNGQAWAAWNVSAEATCKALRALSPVF